MRSQEYYESKGYKNASEYYKDVKWEDTGYVSPELSSESTYPDYIKDEVEQSVKSILSYQSDDTVTFGFMTDLHYAITRNHCIRMKRMLNAYREIKKQTHSSMLLLGGDLTNEGCKEYKAECFRELRKHFEGIDYLPANGNHDDGSIWDISYINAEKSTNQLIILSNQSAMICSIITSPLSVLSLIMIIPRSTICTMIPHLRHDTSLLIPKMFRT